MLLIMGFLSGLFGKTKAQDIFPAENFIVVEGNVNGKPVIGSINNAYKNYEYRQQYPWCLRISIGLDLNNVHENGLPKDAESAIANKLEEDLLADISKKATAHYIGHLYNDTFLDFYIYLDKPQDVHNYLQTQINNESLLRGFSYEITQDPSWSVVKGFLN